MWPSDSRLITVKFRTESLLVDHRLAGWKYLRTRYLMPYGPVNDRVRWKSSQLLILGAPGHHSHNIRSTSFTCRRLSLIAYTCPGKILPSSYRTESIIFAKKVGVILCYSVNVRDYNVYIHRILETTLLRSDIDAVLDSESLFFTAARKLHCVILAFARCRFRGRFLHYSCRFPMHFTCFYAYAVIKLLVRSASWVVAWEAPRCQVSRCM